MSINYCLISFCSFETKSRNFFKSHIIDSKTSIFNVYELFSSTYKMYATELRNSTSNLPKDNFKTFGFYNYLIVDGNHLSDILLDDAVEYSPLPNYLLDLFKGCCIYAGKGSNSRKYQHITDAISRLWVCHANSKPLGKTKQI